MVKPNVVDTTQMTKEHIALRCARLYVRRGKRLLQAGRSSAGLAALYDSALFGMQYYIAKHKSCQGMIENLDLWDACGLFHALARAGILDDPLAFNRFSLLVERALWQESVSFDADIILAEVERMLTKLGVLSFLDSTLPSEAFLKTNDQSDENVIEYELSRK